jgi:hypothetical protein
MPTNAKNRFHVPLEPGDTETQTVGCRHTNAANCGKNSMEGVCAFARRDRMCLLPPMSWPKQFEKLRTGPEPGTADR